MDQEKVKKEFFDKLIKYNLFIKVFDGSVNKWKKHLKEKGSMDQVIGDYNFVLWLEKELKRDPGLLDRIKELVRQYDEIIKDLGIE